MIFCLLFLVSCTDETSQIKGRVEDQFAKKPLGNIIVTAVADIKIEEDLKYSKLTAETDNDGNFEIKGLSPSYRYIVYAEDKRYFSTKKSGLVCDPAPKHKTKILDNPLFLIEKIEIEGRVVDELTGSPVDNAEVKVILQGDKNSSEEIESRLTDANGNFKLPPLMPEKKYIFKISKSGCNQTQVDFSTDGNIKKIPDPFKIVVFPKSGLYISDGKQLQKLNRIEGKKVTLSRQDKYGGGVSGLHHYILEDQARNILKFSKSDAVFVVPIKKDLTSMTINFYKVTFFKELVKTYKGSFGKEQPVEYVEDKNIYVLGRSSDTTDNMMMNAYDKYTSRILISNEHPYSLAIFDIKNLDGGIWAVIAANYLYFFELY